MAKAKGIEAVRGQDDGPKPPPFGTARPAADGPIPRIIDPLDRATSGLGRFKISVRDAETAAVKYVLAKQRDEAEKHLRKSMGLSETATLVVTPLDD